MTGLVLDASAAFERPNIELTWAFGDMTVGAYGMIMADPAWTFKTRSAKGKGKSPERHYNCMTLEAIKALPVAALADPRGCWLWLWATGCMDEMAHEVMKAWGFTYVTQGVWNKTTKDNSRLAFGPGYVLRNCHEPFYIGRLGRPKICSKSIRSSFMEPRREHSRKPETGYRNAELLSGDVRRADLFSRQKRVGWDAWGNETTKFDAPTLPLFEAQAA